MYVIIQKTTPDFKPPMFYRKGEFIYDKMNATGFTSNKSVKTELAELRKAGHVGLSLIPAPRGVDTE